MEVYDCFDNNPCVDAAAGEGGVRYYRHADPTRFRPVRGRRRRHLLYHGLPRGADLELGGYGLRQQRCCAGRSRAVAQHM